MAKAKSKKVSSKKVAAAAPFAVGDRVMVQSEHHKNSRGSVEACTAKTAHVRLDSQVHLDPVPFEVSEVTAL